MTEEERETINHMKTRQRGGGGVSALSLSESGSFKWIRSRGKPLAIDDSGRFVAWVLTHFSPILFIANQKKVKPELLLRSFLKVHAFILPDMRLNKLRPKSGSGEGGGGGSFETRKISPTNLSSSSDVHPAEAPPS